MELGWILGSVLAGLLVVGFSPAELRAATTTYDTNNTPYTGGTINYGDTVLLNDGATVTGDITDNGTLRFNQSAGSTLTISTIISGSGTLSLTNAGTVNLTGNQASGNAVFWDMTTAVSAGSLRILSGTGSLTGGDFYVGTNALGTLDVGGGLVSNAAGVLGYNAGGIGSATVSGGTWANSGDLRVGVFGSGTLGVNGGVVSNANARLGYFAGSVGTAMVSSGTWANSVDLYIGGDGDGTLTVNGGSVTSVNGWLGNVGAGAATVSGGTWVNSGALYVGSSGTGTLSVNGGFVTNGYTKLGYNAGSSGTATVMSGTLTTSNFVIVGERGEGALVVDGGLVANGDAILGWQPGSVGTATITGGTWATSGNLFVGDNGIGTLIMLGGRVSVAGTLSKGAFGRIKLGEDATLQIGVGGTTGVLDVTAITNNGTLVFNRSDDSTYSGIISGTGAVTKQGAGTLNFTGTSSYAGATRVDGGKLLVNGQLGNTAVSVNAGGLLGGSGRILGDVTVDSSGTMSPGNSSGILTVGSLSLLAGSHTLMGITGTSASLYDQIVGVGTGGLTYGGSLDLVMSGSYADQTTFHLFSNFGASNGDFDAVGLNATGEYAGLTFSDQSGVWTSTWTTNHQRLVFSTGTGDLVVVPEPSTYALMVIGAGIVGLMHRRKRRVATASVTA